MRVPRRTPNRSIARRAQVCALIFLLVVFVVGAFHPSPANAQIPVTDINLGTITLSEKIQHYFWRVQDFLRARLQKAVTTASNIAFKHSLRVFAGKLAEDTADWVGNWGTGKKPLFIEDKKYFSKLSDAAAGEFLDTYAISVFGQSVCEPINIGKKLTIIQTIEGLTQGKSAAACQKRCQDDSAARQTRINAIQGTVLEVEAISKEDPNLVIVCVAHLRQADADPTNVNNWEYGAPSTNTPAGECATILNAIVLKEKARDANALQLCLRDCQQGRKKASCSRQEAIKNLSEARVAAQVSLSLQQGQNDLGQIIKLYGETRAKQNEAVQQEETILRGGFKGTRTKVSNEPLVPPDLVRKRAEIALEEAAIAEKTYTGTLAADIISIFTNTVISRWTERIFKGQCGLNPAWCKGPQQAQTFAGQQFINVAAGRQTFSSLGQIEYVAGDASRTEDIFQAMRSRGLTVDDRLTQAVREKKTVQEALDAGLLDGEKTFGYDSQGNEPQDGYPYRLIQYLKHYRVVPVGWELAAQYMKRFDNRNIGLTELARLYGQCDPNNNPSPYCGLIDPNWVLKAPETFCKRRGSGEEIVNRQFVCDQDTKPFNGAGGLQGQPNCGPGSSTPDIGKWILQRNVEYCADEQSCIAENEDGSCRAFGYCFAEKRVWRFDGTACPNYYASCTAFSTEEGLDVSYLTNTVNKEGCSSGNAGCRWYCAVPRPDGTWACSANDGAKLYFDRDAERCSAAAEGCSEYLGVKNGTNLAKNGSFEDFSGTRDDGAPPNDTFPGWSTTGSIRAIGSDNDLPGITNQTAVALNGGDLTMGHPISIPPFHLPGHLTLEPLVDRSFTLSYYAKTTGPACTGDATLDVGGTTVNTVNQNYGPAWERHVVVGDSVSPAPVPNILLNVTIGTPTCEIIVDNVQLEEADGPSVYKDYGSVNNVYLNANRLACSASEIGCELYTPTDGSQRVPGVVTRADTCDANNVGCKAFREMPIDTIPTRPVQDPVYLVPSTGKSCSAAAVGCEEYTNLDAQARGGEAREYYTRIKQCVRPNAADASQQTFFSWVGSDTRGFELRSYRMLRSNSSNALIQNGPCTNLSVGSVNADPTCVDFAPSAPAFCNAADVGSNPDCTEFFNGAGDVFYLLRSRTINVLDDCFPARNSVDQAAGLDTIYMISPGESFRCPAAEANCREYKGNAGNNIRLAVRDTFEGGTTDNWNGGAISNESVSVGGHSMDVPVPGVELRSSVVVPQLTQGKSYILSFWARPQAGTPTILARFRTVGPAPAVNFPGAVTLSNDWNRYSLGPLYFDRAVDPNDVLFINVSGAAYLDNIELREVTDSVFLVKDTARSCPATQANCSIYRDRQNNNHFLRSFTRLCGEDKVGCVELIDTKNSASPFNTTVKGVVTGDDEIHSFVVNSSALCQAEEKGCQAFGRPTIDAVETVTDWETVYVKNNPDRYETILCTASENMCSEFASKLDGAKSYFRDPGSTVCSFERPPRLALCADTVTACTNVGTTSIGARDLEHCGGSCSAGTDTPPGPDAACRSDADCPNGACVESARSRCTLKPNNEFHWILTGTNLGCPSAKLYDVCEPRTIGATNYFCYRSQTDAGCQAQPCATRACEATQSVCNEYRDPNDPPNCRVDCPLEMFQGKPQPVNERCQPQKIADGGVPGCRSYYYLKQTVEGSAGACGSAVNLESGCRPFFDTSNPNRNFRGG